MGRDLALDLRRGVLATVVLRKWYWYFTLGADTLRLLDEAAKQTTSELIRVLKIVYRLFRIFNYGFNYKHMYRVQQIFV